MISFNLESGGLTNNYPDYLLIQNTNEKVVKNSKPRFLMKTNQSISLKFITDWATTEALNKPKGILLYFKSIFFSSKSNM